MTIIETLICIYSGVAVTMLLMTLTATITFLQQLRAAGIKPVPNWNGQVLILLLIVTWPVAGMIAVMRVITGRAGF